MTHQLLKSFLGRTLGILGVCALIVPCCPLKGQDATTERVTVTGERTSTGPDESGFSETNIDTATLDQSPALTLDDVLREQDPGFSLFRRTSSRVANPTNQGVSLRNIGPNGAGRTLVLLDGVPQNDPFGGWVYWSRLPTDSIGNVKIVEGGGAGVFGSAALGGTIELRSRQMTGDAWSTQAEGGDEGTYDVSAAGQSSVADGAVTFFGRAERFSTDGYNQIRSDQRGPVDIDAFSEDELINGGMRVNLGSSTEWTLKADAFREDRGNGTPRTNNGTRTADFSSSLDGEVPGTQIDYQLLAYGELESFSSFFTSINAQRTKETPSDDQYSVPSDSAGGSFTVNVPLPLNNNLLTGVDGRWVEGETNERFHFVQGNFTQGRVAGGEQVFTGFFAEDTWRPTPSTTLSASGRADYYANYDGHRHEYDLAGGATTLDQHFADHDGWVANGRAGASQKIWDDLLRVRTAVYTGFRVPTLNELYRPYRVLNDIIVANPDLQPERLYGVEAGMESQPVKAVQLTLDGYYNELHHPVANVTVARGPGTVAPFGFIPAGGTGEVRENLGRARIYGLETGATWTLDPRWKLSASYLYSHGTVLSAPSAPALEGKRLAQSPEQQGVIGVHWSPWKPLETTLQLRAVGDQFDDDLNTRRLNAYATVDVQISYAISKHMQAWVSVENLFDTEYETGKDSNGLVTVGTPRLLEAGMRLSY